MKKNTIILIAIIALSICTITVVAVNAATSKPHTNTFNYIYDESVYIPEPEEKAANIPDYVRWEPMLGLYVRRDHIYNPETHSFEKVVDTKIDTTSPTYRQEEWLKVNEGSDNKLYLAIIKWYRRDPSTNEMSLSFSGLWNPELDTLFQKEIVSLGHKYIPDMLKLVIDEELWSYPLMEAIDEILGISVISSGESVLDSYEYWHDVWRNDFIQMLKNLKRDAKNGENLEKYGLLGAVYSDTPDISKNNSNMDREILQNIIDTYGKD